MHLGIFVKKEQILGVSCNVYIFSKDRVDAYLGKKTVFLRVDFHRRFASDVLKNVFEQTPCEKENELSESEKRAALKK